MSQRSTDPPYLRYQYGDAEKLRIRGETHRLHSERPDDLQDRSLGVAPVWWLWHTLDAAQAGCAARKRSRSRSKLARPYIWRLSSFNLVMWPSVWPWL